MVYKANPNGTIDWQVNFNFNKIYVDAGYGMIMNDPKMEFDPASWSRSS